MVQQRSGPLTDAWTEIHEILPERLPPRRGKPRADRSGIDRAHIPSDIRLEITHIDDVAERAELSSGDVCGLVKVPVPELGQVFRAHEVMEGIPVMDRALTWME